MDLLRRDAAGELSALFGSASVAHDRKRRFHGLRSVAQRAVINAKPDMRALLDAYAEGVNAGLADLRVRPFEYLLLRQSSQLWKVGDSALSILAMWLTLTDEGAERDLNLTRRRAALTKSAFDYLTQAGSALDGSTWSVTALLSASEVDVRKASAALAHAEPTVIANDHHLKAYSEVTTGRCLVVVVNMVALLLLTTCIWRYACPISGIARVCRSHQRASIWSEARFPARPHWSLAVPTISPGASPTRMLMLLIS